MKEADRVRLFPGHGAGVVPYGRSTIDSAACGRAGRRRIREGVKDADRACERY